MFKALVFAFFSSSAFAGTATVESCLTGQDFNGPQVQILMEEKAGAPLIAWTDSFGEFTVTSGFTQRGLIYTSNALTLEIFYNEAATPVDFARNSRLYFRGELQVNGEKFTAYCPEGEE